MLRWDGHFRVLCYSSPTRNRAGATSDLVRHLLLASSLGRVTEESEEPRSANDRTDYAAGE